MQHNHFTEYSSLSHFHCGINEPHIEGKKNTKNLIKMYLGHKNPDTKVLQRKSTF